MNVVFNIGGVFVGCNCVEMDTNGGEEHTERFTLTIHHEEGNLKPHPACIVLGRV